PTGNDALYLPAAGGGSARSLHHLRFADRQTPLGVAATSSLPIGELLVAATPKGVCKVEIGDSEEKLSASVIGEFPRCYRGARRCGSEGHSAANRSSPCWQRAGDVLAAGYSRYCVSSACL